MGGPRTHNHIRMPPKHPQTPWEKHRPRTFTLEMFLGGEGAPGSAGKDQTQASGMPITVQSFEFPAPGVFLGFKSMLVMGRCYTASTHEEALFKGLKQDYVSALWRCSKY